ncbi:MAG TPA: glycosyl hydrolase family 28 protein [Candidatus Polarisedimenticolia bacterium]|nr:glycosyl hydrolase family 28 protein [Candidatus Polarisedimenticolia bacterium]
MKLLYRGSLVSFLVMVTGVGLAVPSLPAINTNNVITVTDAPYNAVGDNVTTNTAAIQNAIDAAATGGITNGLTGGTVRIPAGVFLSGPLTMKSFVNLQIDVGATLKMLPHGSYPGGASPADFISASRLQDIEISGSGTIDGQGAEWWTAFEAGHIKRPKAIFAPSTCTNVLVQNITLRSPPNTHISLRNRCRDVTIQGVTINTTSDVLSDNTDGIDVNAINCLVQNCFISCGDDHIAIGGGSRSITVTNCTFGNGHGMSIGSGTSRGVQNLLVENSTMTIFDRASLSSGIRIKSGRDRGGLVDNLTYRNLSLTNVQNPIFISCYYPDKTLPSDPTTDTGSAITATTPIWRDIVISNVNIVAASRRNAGRIYGLPEMPITNLTLTKVTSKADLGFVMYHVRNAQFIDSPINVPAGVNTFNLYDVDLVVSNRVFSTNLVRISGWNSASITNRFAFFNARAAFTDSNVLPATKSLSLGNSVIGVSNNWTMNPTMALNFTLGTNNATIAAAGNLALAGTINVNPGGGFANGAYTIATYKKNLTWGPPLLGSVPPGHNYAFDTNTPGQVNLLVLSSGSGTPVAARFPERFRN